MARVLLLIPATTYRARDFLQAAGRLGVDVIVGSDQNQASDRFSEGRTQAFDFDNVDAGAAQIKALAAERPISAIVPVDDRAVDLAAAAAAVLDLPHNARDAVRITRDKFRLRQTLSEAGLSEISCRRVPIAEGPSGAKNQVAYPCVLKPLSMAASRGVIRADDPDHFDQAFRRIARLVDDDTAAILVEDFVPGAEVAFEGILTDGHLHRLALFDKPDPLDGPYFEETIYVTPSRHPNEVQDAIFRTVARAIAAVGLRHGPVHAELRLAPDGPWLIEIAARSIGGLCGRILRFATGLSLEDIIVRQALGEPTATLKREDQAGAVMMIPVPQGGQLREVKGLPAAFATAGIDDVVISIPLGQSVVPWPEGNNYLGFIFARTADPADAEAAVRSAHAQLDFDIVPDHTTPAPAAE